MNNNQKNNLGLFIIMLWIAFCATLVTYILVKERAKYEHKESIDKYNEE